MGLLLGRVSRSGKTSPTPAVLLPGVSNNGQVANTVPAVSEIRSRRKGSVSGRSGGKNRASAVSGKAGQGAARVRRPVPGGADRGAQAPAAAEGPPQATGSGGDELRRSDSGPGKERSPGFGRIQGFEVESG